MSIATEPAVLTADEVAALLRCDRKTVYSMAKRGKIPHRKVGRCVRFSRERILDWLADAEPSH